MKVRTKAAAMTIAAAGVLSSVMIASPAYAAGDGQQINFCGVPAGEQVKFSGTNQNGAFTSGSETIWPDVCSDSLPGWWWIGTVTINWYTSSNVYQGTTYCQVPVKQNGSDWTDCYA
jgi:hypothetical protein